MWMSGLSCAPVLRHSYDLVEPGLIDVIYWRPDPEATDLSDPLDRDVARYSLLGGVGRKP